MKVFDILPGYSRGQAHSVVAQNMADAERLYAKHYPYTQITEIRLHSNHVIVQDSEYKPEPVPAFDPHPGDVVAAWYHCWDRVQLHRYDRYANGFRLVNAVSSYDLLSPPYIAPPIIRDGEIILDVAEYIAAGEYLSGGGADDPEDVQQRL